MKNSQRKIIKVLVAIFCIMMVLLSLAGCGMTQAVKKYKKASSETQDNFNRGNASIIAMAFNSNNVLADEDEKLEEVPATLDDFNEWAEDMIPLSFDKKDYENALPYIEYDEEGEAFVKDE